MKIASVSLVLACLLIFVIFTSFRQPDTPVYVVRMEGMKFIPKHLEIPEGAIVRWINGTNSEHNVVAKEGAFKSPMLAQKNAQYEVRFTRKGTYEYYCAPHRIMGMKGTVVVR